jgi:phosphatidylserine synthase
MKVFGMMRPGAADAVTIGNALCGAAAIGVVIATPWGSSEAGDGGILRIVTLIVLVGAVLDVCDGAVARAFGGTPLGPYLDSLADAVTFGIAPAVAVGGLALRHSTPGESVAVGVAILAYVTAAIVRLADFDAGRRRDRTFTGLPSPLAGAALLSVGLLALSPWLTAGGMLLIGWFMVSGIRYPRHRGIWLLAMVIWLAIAVVGLLGLIDVRIPAGLMLVGALVLAPVTFAVMERRTDLPDAPIEVPIEPAEH